MDINSLLSPTDAAQTAAQPAAPPPVQPPYNYVRRSQPGPVKQGSNTSPLSQSMVSSSIPSHLMSPQQQSAPLSPMRSPSTAVTASPAPGSLGRNNSSTPSMDTLADLASLQNHQPPRSTPPVLRNRESYESQLSPSTIFPQVPSVSVTSNPRAIEPNRLAVRTDFHSTSLPLEIQQQASLLSTSIQERPSAFVSHVELIKILHQGFLNHVYPPSSPNAHGDPGSYDLLHDLRASRENMHKLFAMGEELWVDCLKDESMLARTNDEKIGVINQCLNAIEQEFASTKLWKLYGEWVLHCFTLANSSDSPATEEEKIEGQVLFTWEMVVDTWTQAADATKWRINDSHIVWDQFIDIMIQDLRGKNTQEAAEVVRDLFIKRLHTPHSTWENTSQNFSGFISNSVFRNDWEQIMSEVNRSAAIAKQKWNAREEFETALHSAQESGNGEAEYQAFVNYQAWEQTVEKRRKPDLDLIDALFQRAELRFPSDAKLWEDHILWLIETNHGETTGNLISTLDRATRHCPWSGALWSQYLLSSERQGMAFAETEKIKHKATNTGLLDVGGIDEVLKVHAGWCSYLRRRAFRADANDQNEDLDVAEMGIRSSIGDVQELATKLGNSQTLDPHFRLERIYISFLSESGSWDSANKAFRGLIPKYGNSWEFWMRFYEWEMTRWRRFTHDETRSGQLTKTTRPHFATAVLKDALRQPNLDWPEHLMQKLIDHCEDHEHVDELQAALIEVRKMEKAVKAKREQEGLIQAPVAQYVLTNGTTKRKREEESSEESHKKLKNEDVAPSVEQPIPEPPKRDREHATILVQRLPGGVTETRVRQFFRDCGTINSLKLLQQDMALVEFEDKSSADFALSRSGRDFDGSAIVVSLETGCTLFVTNFPPAADETLFRQIFGQYGEIVDIRLPSLQGNASRRFCYIQFKSSQEAQSALATDGYESDGFKISVNISDPANKQQRSGAAEEERQLFIRNLSFKISEKALKSAFSSFGDVEIVKIPQDDKSRSKGYGFLTFFTHEATEAALSMDGKEIDGREISVTIARKFGSHKGIFSAARSKSPVVNGDAGSPSAVSTSSDHRRDRTIAVINVPDTVNVSRIQSVAEPHGTVKVVLKPNHQGAILEYTDAGAAGKAALALEGYEINPGRTLKVVTVAEMKKEKPEFKEDKIQVGKNVSKLMLSAPPRRPVQNASRRGGLGQKTGLGFRKDLEAEGQVQKGKTNDEFRKMIEKK